MAERDEPIETSLSHQRMRLTPKAAGIKLKPQQFADSGIQHEGRDAWRADAQTAI